MEKASNEIKAQVVELYKGGKTHKEISDITGLSKTTVHRIVKAWKESGNTDSVDIAEETKKKDTAEAMPEMKKDLKKVEKKSDTDSITHIPEDVKCPDDTFSSIAYALSKGARKMIDDRDEIHKLITKHYDIIESYKDTIAKYEEDIRNVEEFLRKNGYNDLADVINEMSSGDNDVMEDFTGDYITCMDQV